MLCNQVMADVRLDLIDKASSIEVIVVAFMGCHGTI